MKTVHPIKDLLRFCIQTSSPPRGLTVKIPQPNYGGKVDEDGVEGDIAIDLASGAEGGKAQAGRTPFMQEPITGRIKVCEMLSGGVSDQ